MSLNLLLPSFTRLPKEWPPRYNISSFVSDAGVYLPSGGKKKPPAFVRPFSKPQWAMELYLARWGHFVYGGNFIGDRSTPIAMGFHNERCGRRSASAAELPPLKRPLPPSGPPAKRCSNPVLSGVAGCIWRGYGGVLPTWQQPRTTNATT